MKIKPCLCIPVLVLSLSAGSCGRSYPEADLLGSWQTVWKGRVTQTYTFCPDHTFTIVTASSKDLRLFGTWAVLGNQLSIVIRSNSFSPIIETNRETARIVLVTDDSLILRDRDRNDEPRERNFRRLR